MEFIGVVVVMVVICGFCVNVSIDIGDKGVGFIGRLFFVKGDGSGSRGFFMGCGKNGYSYCGSGLGCLVVLFYV